jgi:hypothetical protein
MNKERIYKFCAGDAQGLMPQMAANKAGLVVWRSSLGEKRGRINLCRNDPTFWRVERREMGLDSNCVYLYARKALCRHTQVSVSKQQRRQHQQQQQQ